MLWTLKDFAREMDCHINTVRKWRRRLGIEADIVGHGAHKWREASAQKFLKRWSDYYRARGTTLKITSQKYNGGLADKRQLKLPLI